MDDVKPYFLLADNRGDRQQQSSSPDVSASEATTVQRTNVPGFQMHDHGYSQWADGSVRAGGGVMEQGTSDSDDRGEGQVETVLDIEKAKTQAPPPLGELQAQVLADGAETLALAQREEPAGQDAPGNPEDGGPEDESGGGEFPPQPVKRGRGRPRKKQRGVGGRFPKAQPDEAPPPVKRGRGRPRKSESAATTQFRPPPEPAAVPDIDLMPKSSRGRPRKVRKLDSDDETPAPSKFAPAANRLSVNGVFGERRTAWQKDDARERLPPRRPLNAIANTAGSASELAALNPSEGAVVKAELRDGTADSADNGATQSLARTGGDASVGERGCVEPLDERAQAPPRSVTSGMVRNVAGDLVKRGRGRPRKHPLVPPPAPAPPLDLGSAKARLDDDYAPRDDQYRRPDVASSGGAAVQVKRPRGRPPKRRGGRPRAFPAGSDGEGAAKAGQQEDRRDAVGGSDASEPLFGSSHSGSLSSLVYNRLLTEHLMRGPEHGGADAGQRNPFAASLAANAFLSALIGTAKPAGGHDAFGRPLSLASPGYDKVLPLVFQGAYVNQLGHLLPAATFMLPAQAVSQAPPRDPHGLLGAVGFLLGDS